MGQDSVDVSKSVVLCGMEIINHARAVACMCPVPMVWPTMRGDALEHLFGMTCSSGV